MTLSTQEDPAQAAVPPPIPGEPVDPPPKSLHKTLRKVDSKGDAAGSAYRLTLSKMPTSLTPTACNR